MAIPIGADRTPPLLLMAIGTTIGTTDLTPLVPMKHPFVPLSGSIGINCPIHQTIWPVCQNFLGRGILDFQGGHAVYLHLSFLQVRNLQRYAVRIFLYHFSLYKFSFVEYWSILSLLWNSLEGPQRLKFLCYPILMKIGTGMFLIFFHQFKLCKHGSWWRTLLFYCTCQVR